MKTLSHLSGRGLVALWMLPCAVAVHAQTAPAAYLERSQVLPTGSVIHAYRVPTTDVNGKVQYFDLTIDLAVNDAGKIGASASVASVKSRPLQGTKFIAGTYKSPEGYVCTVGVSVLLAGRQQVSMACVATNSATLSASWATGEMAGHPFEVDLRAAGIDQIDGYQNYGWGELGSVGGTWWGCMNTGEIVSAAQAGDLLTLNGYDKGNIQLCGVTLTLQP